MFYCIVFTELGATTTINFRIMVLPPKETPYPLAVYPVVVFSYSWATINLSISIDLSVLDISQN